MLSAKAIYILQESFREPCTICAADKFCPEGPRVVVTLPAVDDNWSDCLEQEPGIDYENVTHIIRGYGGNAFRLHWEGMIMDKYIDLASDEVGVVDLMISTIVGAAADLGTPVRVEVHILL